MHKAVTGRVEAKKLLFHQMQSDYIRLFTHNSLNAHSDFAVTVEQG